MATVEVERVEAPPELDLHGQIMLRAADVLRRVGWCQGDLVNYRGNRCVMGAIVKACAELNALGAWVGFHTTQRKFAESVGVRASVWNDQPGRTANEVIEALERAAIGG